MEYTSQFIEISQSFNDCIKKNYKMREWTPQNVKHIYNRHLLT